VCRISRRFMVDRFIRGCTSLPRGVEVEKGESKGQKKKREKERERERERKIERRGGGMERKRQRDFRQNIVVARTGLARIPEVTVGITFR